MSLRSNFMILVVALSFPFTYTNAEFRTGSGSSSSSVNTEDTSYVVAIFEDKKYICIGSLITWEFVVTALQCVMEKDPKKITVKAGKRQQHVRDADCTQYEEVKDVGAIDIGIIKVNPTFNKDSTVGIIEPCKTTLQPGTEMKVSEWYSGIGRSDKIRSTAETIAKEIHFNAHFYWARESFDEKFVCIGYGRRKKIVSGAPGVVGGALCAVAGSYFSSSSKLYTDLSEGSPALKYVKEKTLFI